MKTRQDAERVVELSKTREALHTKAHAIQAAGKIGVCDPTTRTHGSLVMREPAFVFAHLTDDLRALVMRELDEQIAEIDKELHGLGVAPDPLP